MNYKIIKELPDLNKIKEEYKLSTLAKQTKIYNDIEIKNILDDKSNKFILIIGPCSADNEKSVLDYMNKLANVQRNIKDKILIVGRVYTAKPRSEENAYKGIIHKPQIFEANNMAEGIKCARKLQIKVIEQTGLPIADELLYPEAFKYLEDIISYITIGARSSENQEHRLLSGAFDMPCGIKNPMNGSIKSLINSIKIANSKEHCIFNNFEIETLGNKYAHAILRGYTDKNDIFHSNYTEVDELIYLLEKYNINRSIIIDVSHANSGKDYTKQKDVIKEIIKLRNDNPKVKKHLKGLMIESYLQQGKQDINLREYIPGKSITDGCIDWDETEKLINEIYRTL